MLLDAWQDWECPRCGAQDRTRPVPVNGSRFHPCPSLHGLTAPLARSGSDCTLVAVERGDYLRGAIQRAGDDGKPYMAVETRHGDGHTDRAVFPECAVTHADWRSRA